MSARRTPRRAQAFEKWRAEHAAQCGSVRRALAGGPAEALAAAAAAARRHLVTMFAMKRAVLCSDSAAAILRAAPAAAPRARLQLATVFAALGRACDALRRALWPSCRLLQDRW